MLDAIASSAIVIDPNGTTEPLGNMCSISITYEQAAALGTGDVTSFIMDAAKQFDNLRLACAPRHPMVFYCWTDDSAGQLRFSVISKLPLPFACTTRISADPTEIARELLSCPWLEGIPYSELGSADSLDSKRDSVYDRNQYALNVFTLNLPIACASP